MDACQGRFEIWRHAYSAGLAARKPKIQLIPRSAHTVASGHVMEMSEQLAAASEREKRLREALEKIDEYSDKSSYSVAKRIARDALKE